MPTCKSCRNDYVEVSAHHVDRLIISLAHAGDKIGMIILLRARDSSTLFDAKVEAERIIESLKTR